MKASRATRETCRWCRHCTFQINRIYRLYCEADHPEHLVTQFDKDDVEAVGLVKFDFLGLRTLTIIDWAVKAINQIRETLQEPPLDIHRIPMNDEKSYALLKNCQTTAVFQLESRGMKDLVKRLQPDCFEDIVALVALFRPGPLQSGMVEDFINRKHGRARVSIIPNWNPFCAQLMGYCLSRASDANRSGSSRLFIRWR